MEGKMEMKNLVKMCVERIAELNVCPWRQNKGQYQKGTKRFGFAVKVVKQLGLGKTQKEGWPEARVEEAVGVLEAWKEEVMAVVRARTQQQPVELRYQRHYNRLAYEEMWREAEPELNCDLDQEDEDIFGFRTMFREGSAKRGQKSSGPQEGRKRIRLDEIETMEWE